MEINTGFAPTPEFEGGIPIRAGDIPTETVTLEESLVYLGSFGKIAVSSKLSKKDVLYCAVQCTVSAGDYEGMTVTINYLPLPVAAGPNASKKMKIQAQNTSAAFGRFRKSIKIPDSAVIPTVRLSEPQTIQAFQDFMAKYYGNSCKFMIKNQEFPEGSGRKRSGLSDFVF